MKINEKVSGQVNETFWGFCLIVVKVFDLLEIKLAILKKNLEILDIIQSLKRIDLNRLFW